MKSAWIVTQFLRALVHRRRDSAPGRDVVNSILVVELTRLGDVLSMLPAVRLLVSRYPAATIHLFVDEAYASLLRGLDLEIVVHGIVSSASFTGLMLAVWQARRLGVCLSCSMSPAKRNVVVTLSSGSRFKVGYLRSVDSLAHYHARTHVEARGFAIKEESFSGGDSPENIEERGLRVCTGLGLSPPPAADLRQMLRPETVTALGTKLGVQGKLPLGEYVVVHPFSGWSYRSWSPGNFFTLAHLLNSRLGVDVVFLFSVQESTEWEKSLKHWGGESRPRVFASDDLLESAVLLEGAALFVGNDSGPLHLAACLGVPRIGLFGPSSPSLTAPRAGNGTYLYKPVECSPCEQVKCVRPDSPCINLITPDEAYGAAVKALQSHRPTLSAAHG